MNIYIYITGSTHRSALEYEPHQTGVTLNLFAIKSPWNKYALINMPSRNMLAENCPAEKMPLT